MDVSFFHNIYTRSLVFGVVLVSARQMASLGQTRIQCRQSKRIFRQPLLTIEIMQKNWRQILSRFLLAEISLSFLQTDQLYCRTTGFFQQFALKWKKAFHSADLMHTRVLSCVACSFVFLVLTFEKKKKKKTKQMERHNISFLIFWFVENWSSFEVWNVKMTGERRLGRQDISCFRFVSSLSVLWASWNPCGDS